MEISLKMSTYTMRLKDNIKMEISKMGYDDRR